MEDGEVGERMKRGFLFTGLCLLMFTANLINAAQGVLLSDLIGYYELESVSQGLMSTFQGLGSVCSILLILLLAGKVQRHVLLRASGVLLAFSLLFAAFRLPYFLVVAGFFLFGIGMASTSNLTSALSASLYPAAPSKMGLLHAALGAGGLLGPLVFQSMKRAAPENWNLVFLFCCALGLVVLGLYLLFSRNAAQAAPALQAGRDAIHGPDLRRFFSKRQNLLLLLATVLYAAFQNGVNVWITRYMEVELSGFALAALTLSLFWCGIAAARLIIPRLPVAAEKLLFYGCILSALLLGAGMLLGDPLLMTILTAVSGFVSGAAIPQFYYLSTERNREKTLLASTAVSLAIFFGQMAGAPLTALFADLGLPFALLSISGYALFAALALLPLILERKAQ